MVPGVTKQDYWVGRITAQSKNLEQLFLLQSMFRIWAGSGFYAVQLSG